MVMVNQDRLKESAKQDRAAKVSSLAKQLLLPFDLGEVKFKPQKVNGNRAMAVAYIDARHVMDRLDEVLGIDGWKDEYSVLPGGSEVECRLSLRLAGTWITKIDVGGMSEQPDGGDRMKAAYSDALKRAAVKFGVGRFLYRTQQAWQDFDPVKKRFIYTLKLVQRGDAFIVMIATLADIAAARHDEQPKAIAPAAPTAAQLATELETADRVTFDKILSSLKERELGSEERAIITPAFVKARARLWPEKQQVSA